MPMTKEAVFNNLKRRDVVVLNVLTEEEYLRCHIAGSHHVPLFQNRSLFAFEVEKRFDRKKFFIAYSADVTCAAAQNAVQALKNRGMIAQAYSGGMKEWLESGLPVEGTQVKHPAHSH